MSDRHRGSAVRQPPASPSIPRPSPNPPRASAWTARSGVRSGGQVPAYSRLHSTTAVRWRRTLHARTGGEYRERELAIHRAQAPAICSTRMPPLAAHPAAPPHAHLPSAPMAGTNISAMSRAPPSSTQRSSSLQRGGGGWGGAGAGRGGHVSRASEPLKPQPPTAAVSQASPPGAPPAP